MDRGHVLKKLLCVGALLVAAGCTKKMNMPVPSAMKALEGEASGVVAIATKLDENSDRVILCSGALVAPNLVLTARHCVSRAITSTPSCDRSGKSHNGLHMGDDADPAS